MDHWAQSHLPVELIRLLLEIEHLTDPREQPRRIELCYVAIEELTELQRTSSPDLSDLFGRLRAKVQLDLGIALAQNPHGDRARQLEEAIACFKDAVTVFTREDFPEYWVRAQLNLGGVYRERLYGPRRQNLEDAREHLEAALAVGEAEGLEYDRATVAVALAAVYALRIDGSEAMNAERAITLCQDALPVLERVGTPLDWALAHNTLGAAYLGLTLGDRQASAEKAIEQFTKALQIWTRREDPARWAEVHVNIAVALGRLSRDRRTMLGESAIGHLRAALDVLTPEHFPAAWASAQNNLGVAYLEAIAEDSLDLLTRMRNIEEAIACFEAAQTVYTPTTYPEAWARALVNEGSAYCIRMVGQRQQNVLTALQKYRSALECFTPEAYPREHLDIELNIAWTAYSDLVRLAEGEPALLRTAYENAATAFAAAASMEAELGWRTVTPRERTVLLGARDSMRHLHARHAWSLIQLDRTEDAVVALEAGRAQAIADAQAIAGAALEGVCDDHKSLFEHARQAWQNALAHSDRDDLQKARVRLRAARDTIRAHCQATFLPDAPTCAEIRAAADVHQCIIYLVAVDDGGFALVVPPTRGKEEAERQAPIAVRLPHLTRSVADDWLVRHDVFRRVVGGYLHAVQQRAPALLQQWLDQIQNAEERSKWEALPLDRVPETLPASMATLRWALERVLADWERQALELERGNASRQARAQKLRASRRMAFGEALRTKRLDADLNWWFLTAELDVLLPQVAEVIWEPLLSVLESLRQKDAPLALALVPCGRLGALPLHAAPLRTEGTAEQMPLQERYEVSYQASARALASARDCTRVLPAAGPFLCVGDPQPTNVHPLPWAEAEADALVRLACRAGRKTSRALLGTTARRDAVMELLRAAATSHRGAWVDVSSHGYADPTDPTNCFMLLGGFDAHRRAEVLTLADLQGGRLLEGVRCFAASGCVTAVPDLETAPDELSSFAAGVLQAGAAAAIATQWFVSDLATFLLMLRLARVVLGNPQVSPAQALRDAASWLRHARWPELDALAKEGLDRVRPLQMGPAHRRHLGVRGLPTATRDAAAMIPAAVDAEDGVPGGKLSFVDGLRFAAAQAGTHIREWAAQQQQTERPFEHPIYWACVVIYGA